MSGSLGGGRSNNYQEQTSEGFSQSEQMSQSQSMSQGQSRQNIAFGGMYDQLYTNAGNVAGTAARNAGQLRTAAEQLFTGGSQFLESLGTDAGSDYLANRLGSENPVLESQISQLREDTGRLFREELNPAITARAVGGGTLGGGRQGVAQGLAIDSAARAFTQGATALRAGDVASRDSVAQSVATNSLTAASTGLSALPSLLNVLEGGNSAELDVYSQLGSILGGPTTLTQSDSRSESIAESLARAYGEQSSRGYGRGRSWNFDTSFGVL